MTICDGLDLKCPTKACIYPEAAVFQGGPLGKRLDHKGSDLISGIIWRDSYLIAFGETEKNGKWWGLSGRSKSLGACP